MSPIATSPVRRAIWVLDGMNLFTRYFMANETISTKSEPIGGVVGFLKFVNSINQNFSPGKIYITWESGGASPRRKAIYSDYKANRGKMKEKKLEKIARGLGTMKEMASIDDENRVKQLGILYSLLNTLPVCQIFVADTEGDDLVSYLVKDRFAGDPLTKDAQKVIVSNDKDFYQLLDDPLVSIYDPAKKVFFTADDVHKTYGISARNFCLAKALVGDNSDNVPGVSGLGFKTAQKRFSELLGASDKDATIDDIIIECHARLADKKTAKVKVFKDIVDSEEIIKRNWKLMYLNTSALSANQVEKVNYAVDSHSNKLNKLGFIKTLISNGIQLDIDIERMCSVMTQNLLFS